MATFSHSGLLLLILSSLTLAQIQFFNFTAAETNLTDTCLAVLNQAVSCDTSLGWAGGGRYEDDDTLKSLCTTDCSSSLSTWFRRTSGACTNRIVDGSGRAILPAYLVESVVENFNQLCLQNKYALGLDLMIIFFG
jgi:hypothetical protein